MENKIVIFDSNVWLDLYKLPPPTIGLIVNAINRNSSNFWIPNQVYIEYNRHLKKNRDYAVKRYEKLKSYSLKELNDARSKIKQQFSIIKNDKITDVEEINQEIEDKIEELSDIIKSRLTEIDKEHKNDVKCISSENDVVNKLVEKLHNDNDIKPFNLHELLNIYEEGETRFKYGVPPGVTDRQKDKHEDIEDYNERKYGDLVIWKEVLNFVNIKQKDIIFVENEKKKDWWQARQSNKMSTILEREFNEITNDKNIEMIRLEDFLNNYYDDLGLPQKPIKEIVEKSKYAKLANEYFIDDFDCHLSELLQNEFEENYVLNDKLDGYSFFDGIFSDAENIEVGEPTNLIIKSSIDEHWEKCNLNSTFSIEVSTDITADINGYITHNGNVTLKLDVQMLVSIPIDFSDLSDDPSLTIDDIYILVYEFILVDAIEGDYEPDISVDEDVFRDR